jgi:hypothetical protein
VPWGAAASALLLLLQVPINTLDVLFMSYEHLRKDLGPSCPLSQCVLDLGSTSQMLVLSPLHHEIMHA